MSSLWDAASLPGLLYVASPIHHLNHSRDLTQLKLMCHTLLTCASLPFRRLDNAQQEGVHPVVGVGASVQVGLVAAEGGVLLLACSLVSVPGVGIAPSLASTQSRVAATEALSGKRKLLEKYAQSCGQCQGRV